MAIKEIQINPRRLVWVLLNLQLLLTGLSLLWFTVMAWDVLRSMGTTPGCPDWHLHMTDEEITVCRMDAIEHRAQVSSAASRISVIGYLLSFAAGAALRLSSKYGSSGTVRLVFNRQIVTLVITAIAQSFVFPLSWPRVIWFAVIGNEAFRAW